MKTMKLTLDLTMKTHNSCLDLNLSFFLSRIEKKIRYFYHYSIKKKTTTKKQQIKKYFMFEGYILYRSRKNPSKKDLYL